jgi:hypothetical protein
VWEVILHIQCTYHQPHIAKFTNCYYRHNVIMLSWQRYRVIMILLSNNLDTVILLSWHRYHGIMIPLSWYHDTVIMISWQYHHVIMTPLSGYHNTVIMLSWHCYHVIMIHVIIFPPENFTDCKQNTLSTQRFSNCWQLPDLLTSSPK